jgi:hypothetical protein
VRKEGIMSLTPGPKSLAILHQMIDALNTNVYQQASHGPQSTKRATTNNPLQQLKKENHKTMATKITTTLSGAHAAKLHEVLQAAPKQTATVAALTDHVATAIQDAGQTHAKKVTLNLAPAKHEALGKIVAGHVKQTATVCKLHEKLVAAAPTE